MNIPDNVIARRSVPQLALLPHVDAFITHAGMNSTTEALYHGVPLVAVPFFGDQLMNADVIASHGAGVTLDRRALDATAITNAVRSVLTDRGYRDNAAAAARALRGAGGVARAIEVLDEAAAPIG